MKKAPIPSNEKERLNVLKQYKILDTLEEKTLDDITKLASIITDCPISLISLVDENRQWFKSKQGLNVCETARDISYCGHAILGDDIFIVEDASLDERFADNPLLLNPPHVRFYAGVPLTTPSGYKIGTLCVIDSKPKKLDDKQINIFKNLAKQIVNFWELNKKTNQLIESEEKIKKLFNNMVEGLVVQSNSGKIIEFNPAALKILGLTEDQLLGKDSVDPKWQAIKEDGSKFEGTEHPAMITLKTGKQVENVTMGIRTPDDKLKWIKINSVPIINNGEINSLTTFKDITKQKKLEKEISESNQYLSLAIEGSGLGIWDWNLIDNSVKFDKRWVEILGLDYDKTIMELSTWDSRVHPDDLDNCYKDIQNYLDGKTDRYENVHRMKHENGKWVYILDRGRFSAWDENGKPIRFTGTHLDITEATKGQEDKLLEFNEIISTTPSCLKIINKEGLLLDINSKGLELIESDNLNSVIKASVYNLVVEEDRESFKKFNEHICAGNKGSLTFEIIGLKGTRRNMESYAAPFKLTTGEIAHIAITNDITEKVKSYEEYMQQKAISQHQSKLAAIGELAAGVGHEINNPLAIIKGFISNIDKKSEQNLLTNSTLVYYTSKINVAIDRIAKIVQGLRTFSRADTNENIYFEPMELIQESVGMVKEIYAKDEVDIILSLENSDNLFVYGNRGRFQQVLINLMSNAKDALEKQINKNINIKLFKQEESLIMEVSDNGCGIPLELQKKIFEPFFTTKEVNKGTGIGLSLVNSFIKEMKGEILIQSKENEGTKFIIKVPLSNNVHLEKTKQEVTFDKYNGSILLADDEPEIREILEGLLSDKGFKVTIASDGLEAYEVYCQNPNDFDLIITDMQMPRMNGIQLINSIVNNKQINQPKIAVMTGGINVNFEDTSNDLFKNIIGYVCKPFDKQNLKDILDKSFKDK